MRVRMRIRVRVRVGVRVRVRVRVRERVSVRVRVRYSLHNTILLVGHVPCISTEKCRRSTRSSDLR